VTEITSVDLSGKVPPIGPVHFLRAEWKTFNARFVLVWYEVGGIEQPLALRLDLDKQAFLDDPSTDDADISRAVRLHASDVARWVAADRRARAVEQMRTAATAGA